MTDLEKLLDFYAGTGEEFLHDTEFPWSGKDVEKCEQRVTLIDEGHGTIHFIFDREGKYLDKWVEGYYPD